MKDEKKSLDLETPAVQDKFLAFVESWIRGEKSSLKVRGTKEQLAAVSKVLVATRNFQNEINKSNASLDVIAECLSEKKNAAAEFEKIVGMKWPL